MQLRSIVPCIAVLMVVSVGAGDARESRLRVEISPPISAAPAVVRIRAIVMPDAANRTLQIEADSAAYYRSSVMSLDGESAAPINEMTLSNIPGGEYDVIVAVIASDGHRTVDRRQFVVTSTAMMR